jgi:hypothetical protein
MGTLFARITQFIEKPYVVVLTWVVGNFAFLIALFGLFGVTASYSWMAPVLYVFATSLFGFAVWCTYTTYHENKRLKACIHELHQVNHLYRDAISNRFFDSGNTENLSDGQLIEQEKAILHHVCAKISSIFLTNRKCFVGVYLIRTKAGQNVCSLHSASEYEAVRFPTPPETFIVSPDNTRFWEAGVKRPCGINYFHSPDLKKLPDFNDQTQHYESRYKSCIVVPIRYCPNREGAKPDDLGFLVVDTLARERLNNGYHVHYLAAFADQMYNFQNIWRLKKSNGAANDTPAQQLH